MNDILLLWGFVLPLFLVSGGGSSGLDPSPWVCRFSCGVRARWWVPTVTWKHISRCFPTATRTRKDCLLSVVSHRLIPFNSFYSSVPAFSQKVWHRWQPLWDHHLGWDSLLLPSCDGRRKEGMDQCDTGGFEKWEITVAVRQPPWHLSIVKRHVGNVSVSEAVLCH